VTPPSVVTTRVSVDAADAPVVETGASIAWTGWAVVKTDTRVDDARAVHADAGARVATTEPRAAWDRRDGAVSLKGGDASSRASLGFIVEGSRRMGGG
jgi:hypothetical protein